MPAKAPLTIGLPVFNGERFLAEALESLLGQSYGDFELLICDNASTDGTSEIARAVAEADGRVRYVPADRNRGAVWNYNRCVSLAASPYFKWAAHDDMLHPSYLASCMTVMESEPQAVIAHSMTQEIDERGHALSAPNDKLNLRQQAPQDRLRGYLLRRVGGWTPVFGVIRKPVLDETRLLEGYLGSDQVLLGELVLRGGIYRVDERLFYKRRHGGQSYKAHAGARSHREWFAPDAGWGARVPMHWRHAWEYARAIGQSDLPARERLGCYRVWLRWCERKLIRQPLRRRLYPAVRNPVAGRG